MTGIYMVSAQKPTSVTHSILGRVSSPSDLNLIICKCSLIEIYKVTAEGLKFLTQVSLWAVVENMNIIRNQNDTKDSILITTAKYDMMILVCEPNADGSLTVETKSHGNFKDTIPRNSSTHMLTVVDAQHHLIAVKCYDGILKLLDANSESKQLNLSTLRMIDLNVIDITFTHGFKHPTMAVISKEPTNKLVLKFYEVDANQSKELSNMLHKKDIYDNQAFLITVPKPHAGVIVVGTQAITYFNPNYEAIQKSPSFLCKGEITNHALIDQNGQRFLLSNTVGQLYLMVLISDDFSSKIIDLKFEYLGETSIAHSVTYIDNGHVFIGSKLGDSQLIKLTENPDENGSYVTTLETYTNLGPILDMLVVDIQKQGQGQLITCSGASKNGSLRIIRSGIGIQEMANIELPGVKTLWPLKINSKEFDDHLVLSYFNYSKIFSFFGEEFDDIELDGFDLNSQTITCVNASHEQILQITSTSVRLIKINSSGTSETSYTCSLADEWKTPGGEMISVAVANSNECLFACRSKLNYIRINNGSLEFVKSVDLTHEIACLDIYSADGKSNSDLCAVGLWNDISAVLLTMPNLEKIIHEPLRGDIIPRSILIENLEGILYLFVSLGDGSVISYIINKHIGSDLDDATQSLLTERRVVILGTQPTILRKFSSSSSISSPPSSSSSNQPNGQQQQQRNVFACSDRPSVISSGNQKLVYSSVNLKQVEYACELNASGPYANCLALLSAGVLRIGKMDSIQKLHIRNVPLHESVRRIAYQAETQTFGILCIRMDTIQANGELKPMMASSSTQCSNMYISKPNAGGLVPNTIVDNQQQNGGASGNNGSGFVPHLSKLTPDVNSTSINQQTSSTANQPFNPLSNGQFDTVSTHSFLIFDQNTFEVLQSVQFGPNEYALSILSTTFENEPSTAYYIIGTAQINEDEPEPRAGRLVVFKYGENKLVQVCEREVKGAPYCLASYNNGRALLVGVSNTLKMYEFTSLSSSSSGEPQLNLLSSYSDNVFVVHLKCKNDFILIGDMMKSCAVLTYKHETSQFECVARDHSPAWLSSLEIIDDDHFLMCDGFQNVACLRKDSGQSNEDDRKSLQTYGLIHVGENINVFRHGSLGMHQQSNESLGEHITGSILAGSVSGSILLFSQLSESMFKILNELQIRLTKTLITAGKIKYDKWRMFETERRVEQSKNFIDGDLIESYLELSPTEAASLLKDFKVDGSYVGHNNEEFSVSYFNKLVEELSRLH